MNSFPLEIYIPSRLSIVYIYSGKERTTPRKHRFPQVAAGDVSYFVDICPLLHSCGAENMKPSIHKSVMYQVQKIEEVEVQTVHTSQEQYPSSKSITFLFCFFSGQNHTNNLSFILCEVIHTFLVFVFQSSYHPVWH